MMWLKEHGAPEQGVELRSVEPPAVTGLDADPHQQHPHPHNKPIDMAVASRPLALGDCALRVPEHLVITLDRVFESEFVAELLTTDKLSELACLTLYLMFEKKTGEGSFWQPYIKELDRQRARGTQAVESPLLWDDAQLEDLLTGSPLLGMVRQRLAGIEKEYQELDTVWYMSKSLFNKYPFDLPTQTFSYTRFRQAFAAVQASIVHLQGVPLAKRFALVPLGPPLLGYSSTSKAMLTYNNEAKAVELVVDKPYAAGEPVTAWCGPQPNSRLLLNYGLVDEMNPYDKLQMTASLATTDPLYQLKRATLQAHQLATTQVFDLARSKPMPPMLLPYMRLALATTTDQVTKVVFSETAKPTDPSLESLEPQIHAVLQAYLARRLAGYKHPVSHDMSVMQDPRSTPRQKVAARLLKIEKSILMAVREQLGGAAGTPSAAGTNGSTPPAPATPHLKLQ